MARSELRAAYEIVKKTVLHSDLMVLTASFSEIYISR